MLGAKALLPEQLSVIVSYVDNHIQYYSDLIINHAQEEQIAGLPEREPYGAPTSHRSVFVECIRYGPKDVRVRLMEILKDIQIHEARTKSYLSDITARGPKIVLKENVLGELVELTLIHAAVSMTFDYARGRAKMPMKLDVEAMMSSLRLNDVDEALVKELAPRINSMHQACADDYS